MNHVIKLFNDYSKIESMAKCRSIYEEGLKILNPKQMLRRLPIALAQLKADNTSGNLLNKIGQIIYSLYWEKEITKKTNDNLMKSIRHGYYIFEF